MTSEQDRESSSNQSNVALTQKINISLAPENISSVLGNSISPDMLPPVDREKLAGKVAVISGSTQGIGFATARLFGEMGMKVVINGRPQRQEVGELSAQEIKAIGDGADAVFIPADVTTEEGAEALINGVVDVFGRIDVVVNNVGTKQDNLILTMKTNQWYDVMRTNVDSAFFVTRAAVKKMVRNRDPKGGDIVYVSSIGKHAMLPGQTNYSASKSAMEAIAIGTASELNVKRDIYTSILRPALVDTPLTADLTDEQRTFLRDSLNSSDDLTPEDAARAIVYLVTHREPEVVQAMTLIK